MTGRNYKEMIKELQYDRKVFQQKIEQIDAAIQALQAVTNVATVETVEGSGIKGEKRERTNPYANYEIDISKGYDKEGPVPDMLIYALKIMKGATAIQAAEYMATVFKDHSKDLLERRFTDIASSLYRAGKINAVKLGKRFKYVLKEEKNSSENIQLTKANHVDEDDDLPF